MFEQKKAEGVGRTTGVKQKAEGRAEEEESQCRPTSWLVCVPLVALP